MAEPHIHLQHSGAIWTLKIDRPAVRNALGLQTFAELERAIEQAAASDVCRVLILTTTGHHFIAGGDLHEFEELQTDTAVRAMSQRAKSVLARLNAMPQVVIAAIEGDAIGGGCEVALACDMRVLGESARFRFWQVRNAVTTGWGGGYHLVNMVGKARAMELLLTGATVSAGQALQLGLANRVVPAGQALHAAKELAQTVCDQPPLAVKALTQLVRSIPALSREKAEDLETDLFSRTWLTEEHVRAIRAFREGRSTK